MKVKIKCKQLVHFEQEVELTDQQFEILSNMDNETVSEKDNLQEYHILNGVINYHDTYNCDDEFIEFEICKI